jgi:hypothetical protein
MEGSIVLIVVLVGIAVGVAALLIYRQRSIAQQNIANVLGTHKHAHKEPSQKNHAAQKNHSAQKNHPAQKSQVEQWGVRVAASAKAQTCPQARGLLGKEFPLSNKPPLPVKDCPFPAQCECHYIKLFDRRKEERRSGKERRQAQRFEKGHHDRRSGKDRRKNRDVDWT